MDCELKQRLRQKIEVKRAGRTSVTTQMYRTVKDENKSEGKKRVDLNQKLKDKKKEAKERKSRKPPVLEDNSEVQQKQRIEEAIRSLMDEEGYLKM